MKIRKTVYSVETIHSEAGHEVASPIRRAYAVVVIENPFAGRYVEDLSPLFDAGEQIGQMVIPKLVALLEAPVTGYGKAAIIGADGDLEHGSAVIHPKLGKPVRAGVGGGQSVMPSNIKIGAPGTVIDVPLGHKDDPWSFPEMDSISVMVGDAPRPRELAVVVAVSAGTRPNARSGKSRAAV
jgi:hypothetical protein